ncbi:MAG: Competence protein ComM [Bacteroidetes bacterium ADurb.BinA104]|jgi:magnesium chelatase family protein|nr:MAG: Competence protein ComM [Bacteroidetes bacterium ADurb.BinA104]
MLVKVFGAAVQGIDAYVVTIEANTSRGIRFFLVGLPDIAVKESHERIVSVFNVNGYKFPSCQIIINMAPADIRKEGASYDLPLAIGIMAAAGQINTGSLSRYIIMGEMGLDGTLQPIKGALSIAMKARTEGFEGVILPIQNAPEAAVIEGIDVYGAKNIREVVDLLNDAPDKIGKTLKPGFEDTESAVSQRCDFADIKGQIAIKRAIEVAAAGGHNMIMIGPPGSGKSMIAKALPSILPPLTEDESIETTRIHSVAGFTGHGSTLITERPFRNPHHTITGVALTGGGSNARPGEISLAHNGVLYLDELPEFARSSLEVLRQPLEDRTIVISRAKYRVEYPASFMLVASMNPCPCGYYNHPTKECHCTPPLIERYLRKISGPLMDRFDLQCEILPVGFEDISSSQKGESSLSIRERVIKARRIQASRFVAEKGVYCNAQMSSRLLRRYAMAEPAGLRILGEAMNRLNLSARAYDRILKVARTIADMEQSRTIEPSHIAEAVAYRSLDRGTWGHL